MEQYQIKICNRFAALENGNDSKDINMAWGKKRYHNNNIHIYINIEMPLPQLPRE